MSVLPADLLHPIIAQLADEEDRPTLTACCLAGRWLLAPSQQGLFSVVNLTDTTDVDTFMALVVISPHLCGYITSLLLEHSALDVTESFLHDQCPLLDRQR